MLVEFTIHLVVFTAGVVMGLARGKRRQCVYNAMHDDVTVKPESSISSLVGQNLATVKRVGCYKI